MIRKRVLVVKSPERKGWWLEEYHGCNCTFVAKTKREMIGYCGVHGGDRRGRAIAIPAMTEADLGLA